VLKTNGYCSGNRKRGLLHSCLNTKILFSVILLLFLIGSVRISNNLDNSKKDTTIKNADNTKVFNTNFSTKNILFQEPIQISSTGLDSLHTKIAYNPYNNSFGVTWLDVFNPGTPGAISSLYFSAGDYTSGWNQPISVHSVFDTLTHISKPYTDSEGNSHILFEEKVGNDYEILDNQIISGQTSGELFNITTNNEDSILPITTIDTEGKIHAVWIDYSNSITGDLFYSSYDPLLENWEAPETITTNMQPAQISHPALACDEDNTLHLVWVDSQQSQNYELYYSYKENSTDWKTPYQISSQAYTPINPVIAIDNDNDELHVIFKDNGTSTNLYHLHGDCKSNNSWVSPTFVTAYLETTSSYDITINQNSTAMIVYKKSYGSREGLYFIQKNATEQIWSSETAVSSVNNNAFDPSIAITPEGIIYVAYSEAVENASNEISIRYGFIDSDNDLLSDIDEQQIYQTDPFNPDTDGDTLTDGDEVLILNTDPLSTDSDNDQIIDDFEVKYDLDPLDDSDANIDNDSDGLTNLEEFQNDLNPNLADTDGDDLLDGEEINVYSTDPKAIDTDKDGLNDGYEVQWNLDPLVEDDITADPDDDGLTTEYEAVILTDPLNSDTDGDGYSDGTEVEQGTDPLDSSEYPIITEAKDYRNIAIAILIVTMAIFAGMGITFFIVRQFRPKKAAKRRELEQEEKEYFSTSQEKGKGFTWEQKEQDKLEEKALKRFESLLEEKETEKVEEKQLVKTKEVEETELEEDKMVEKELPKDLSGFQRISTEPEVAEDKTELELADEEVTPKEPIDSEKLREEIIKKIALHKKKEKAIDEEILEEKKKELQEQILNLQEYLDKLMTLKKNKMSSQNVRTLSGELLTEYANESQTLYNEAKMLWDDSILEIIKGYENPLHSETLKAESILDNISKVNDEILDVLVNREMELTDKERKKEEIIKKAKKAIEIADEETENENKDES
jgi:hypothetical protein